MIKFYESKNLCSIMKILTDTDLVNPLLEKPVKSLSFSDLNLKNLRNKDLKIYHIRNGFDLIGLVFVTIYGESAQFDVVFVHNARGKTALSCAEPIIKDFCQKYKVYKLYGKIRVDNLGSLMFSRWAKFKPVSNDGEIIRVERYG